VGEHVFESDLTIAFLSHWRGLRRDGALPVSEDYLDNIDTRLAPLIILFECTDDDVIVRLQGTKVVERWGYDKTGQSWLAAKPAPVRAAIRDNMADCVSYKCGVWAKSTSVTRSGRAAKLENLTLPLSARSGRPGRLVTLSNLLDAHDERDGAKERVDKRALDWFDLGLGIPGHALRPHG